MSPPAARGQTELEKLKRRLERERRIRAEAEQISERATSELYERQRELELLEAVANEWNAAGTIEEAIQVALDRICEHTGWPAGHAYLSDEDRILRSVGSEDRTFASGEGLPGRILEGGEPAWSDDPAAFGFPVLVRDEVIGVLEFFATTRLEPDESLLRSVMQIGNQLGQLIERMRAEAQGERVKAEFFALVSHELRTPLTSIRGYLDLVLEQEADGMGETGRGFLDVIARNAKRLEDLVADLLLVTQVEAGSFKVNLGTVDFALLAEEAVEAARPRAAHSEISLTYGHEHVPECAGDPARLAQAFDNLISNAIKFTPEGGRVDVRVSNGSSRAMFEIRDTGPGVPEEELKRLFERFYRAKGAQSAHAQGAGLGLAITEAIVEAHNGMIDVASEVGEGTTFRIELPLVQPA